jgi:RND family efflux transporter MFP subunit
MTFARGIPALTLAVALAGSCRGKAVEEIETTAAAPVKVITVAPGTVQGIVAATALVAAAPGADWVITAPEPARILELPKAEGDRVRTGDLLVRFEIPAAATELATRHAEVEQAQARVENAKASADRLGTLVEHGVAAQKELEDARRELAEARAALGQAQAASQSAAVVQSRAVVRARFDGVVAKRGHNPGDMVESSASDVILRVIDPSRLQVVAAVPIPELRRIDVGQHVRILVPGSSEAEEGRVLSRPAAVDPSGVSADVRIAFGGSTRLAAGTPVRVEIAAEERRNALAVPVEALIHEDDETFVMIAGSDKKAHKRKVELGLITPTVAEVVAGLKAGEQVIVQGQQGLPDAGDIVVSS